MFNWLNKLIDSNDREIKRLRPIAERVGTFEQAMIARSDDDLRAMMAQFRDQLAQGQTDIEKILPEVFAAVREAAKRAIGQRHYDVQLIGGMVLHHGKIAEMKTGEGKTLVATLPASLNALSGEGVHVVTVNDYLARRDTQWMGAVYHKLGLSVACIQHDTSFLYDPDYVTDDPREAYLRPIGRRDAYAADITYGTNSEFGFDYLRDNMASDPLLCVQRELHYAIVDEVDNILIDEARTPLIISGAAEDSGSQYAMVAKIAPQLRNEQDYIMDEKAKSVSLTESGIDKLERALHIDNLYDPSNYQMTHFAETALKALVLYKRDRDYIVKDGEVIIVDEFTGRQMPGRRWSDGIHQAVEAKENVKVQQETLTMATITLQNYFRMFKKLAGMTGTAVTEAEEFAKIYNLEVVVIPTNKPMVRKDSTDLVYKTIMAKFEAVVDEIKDMYEEGRPVLVGTVSVEKSEIVSELLNRQGVPHNVLNAKFHEREAEIVAQAGRPKAITIATNMAGRGTDIILGGNPDGLALQEAIRREIEPSDDNPEYQKLLAEMRELCAADHQKVVELGGLHIVGTERHESRRIDNQLRGRAGRQGDPGSSRFYVALDDDVLRRFGGENIKRFMDWAGLEDDVPIEHGLINKSIENAQTKVESANFDIRKHLVDYDDVMNTQRKWVYQERRKILEGADLRSNVIEMVHQEIEEMVDVHLEARDAEDWDAIGLLEELGAVLPPIEGFTEDDVIRRTKDEVKDVLLDHADAVYEAREAALGEEGSRYLERMVLLRTIDQLWVSHLTEMEDMKQGIGLRAYAQTDPLVAYKKEAYEMYERLRETIRKSVATTIFKYTLVQQQPAAPQPVAQHIHTNQDSSGALLPSPVDVSAVPQSQSIATATAQRQQPVTTGPKVGRNDPCWCGSGKKFKRCHGA